MDYVMKKQPSLNPNDYPLNEQQPIIDFEKFQKMLEEKESPKKSVRAQKMPVFYTTTNE